MQQWHPVWCPDCGRTWCVEHGRYIQRVRIPEPQFLCDCCIALRRCQHLLRRLSRVPGPPPVPFHLFAQMINSVCDFVGGLPGVPPVPAAPPRRLFDPVPGVPPVPAAPPVPVPVPVPRPAQRLFDPFGPLREFPADPPMSETTSETTAGNANDDDDDGSGQSDDRTASSVRFEVF